MAWRNIFIFAVSFALGFGAYMVMVYSRVPPSVAFIIDDWGYNNKNCGLLREIKYPLDIAVLPDLQYTDDIIQCAFENQKEIMLHLPLEAYNNPNKYPEDYIINSSMSTDKIKELLGSMLVGMPHISGVNNHMGSKATEDPVLMAMIFKELKDRGLFFVDSMDTQKSASRKVAHDLGLPFTERDVFLDNINEASYIKEKIGELARIAKKQGYAVAIGHDRSLTLEIIKDQIDWLRSEGIEIISVSELISRFP